MAWKAHLTEEQEEELTLYFLAQLATLMIDPGEASELEDNNQLPTKGV